MTHTYLSTVIESESDKEKIRSILLNIPNIEHVHFAESTKHISLTLNAYISLGKINRILKNEIKDFELIRQVNVSPNFTEASETTGKIFKEFGITLFLILIITLIYGGNKSFHEFNYLLTNYVGFLLICFGILKILKLMDFAESHQRYDIISKHFVLYAYLYPFLELFLGLGIVFNYHLVFVYLILVLILFLRLLSVLYSIAFSEGVEYAYLDGTLKIRISYATLFIDLAIILFALFQITLLIK